MKSKIIRSITLLIIFFGFAIILSSCQYKDIADAPYPDQLIYMPTAVNGFYNINAVAAPRGNTTPGFAYRYTVDKAGRKFIIPLGVYRSGINNSGAFTVNVAVNTDTINKLIAQVPGKLPTGTLLLPTDKYSTVPSVDMKDGEETATFNLSVDLDFLIANYGNTYAIGVTISSTARKTNPLIATTIVVIDTKFMIPIADFSVVADAANDKLMNFTTSINAIKYAWDYGDGSPIDTLPNPKHLFASYGTKTVTLTATGVIGVTSSKVISFKLWENVTSTFIKNPGYPFLRSDTDGTRFGLLKDWLWTPNVLSQDNNTHGGFSTDGGGLLHYETQNWSGPGLTNGKIYQTFTLPAGDYRVTYQQAAAACSGSAADIAIYNCNFVVSTGSIIPDIQAFNGGTVLVKNNSALGQYPDNTKITVYFSLTSSTQVALGFVCTYGTFSHYRCAGIKMEK